MAEPWSERQRVALRAFREAIAVRAEREDEIATGLAERTRDADQGFRQAKEALAEALRQALAAAQAQAEQSRVDVATRHDASMQKADAEFAGAQDAAARAYGEGKEALEAEFQEARWTINTVYESDKKVAKEQLAGLEKSLKETVVKLRAQRDSAREYCKRWSFVGTLTVPAVSPETDSSGEADGAPALPPAVAKADDGADPWEALQGCLDQAEADMEVLPLLRAPKLLVGMRPWVIVAAVWLILSSTAFPLWLMFNEDETWLVLFWLYWLVGTTALVPPIGMLIVARARAWVRDVVARRWESLCAQSQRARVLKPLCQKQARAAYIAKHNHSRRRNRSLLQQTAESTKRKLKKLRRRRGQALRAADVALRARRKRATQEQAKQLAEVEAALAAELTVVQERHDADQQQLGQRYHKSRDENNHRHAQEWTHLLRYWKQGCDQFVQTSREVARECRRWFPPWDEAWRPTTDLPLGLPIGEMSLTLDDFNGGVPQDPQLPKPDLGGLTFPALLPFPEQASLLFNASEEGKARAIQALQAILLHAWTGLPPGKIRSTIIDPVGRGENFSAFMHLADHEEALIHGRIWTEASHIEQRLADLTGHMENVLQKYLRNQFQTLAEYNAQAGEVAEPFRFLVVADFPVNFTPDACRRLISLASAGARCGIYTFVMLDEKQTLPQGIERTDLERACTCLDWVGDRFVWRDDDFGSFALRLDASPSPERCTELLDKAGDAAKRAARVEVPFEWIAPPHSDWWTGDSRHGISVALGRVGARARQMLSLGQGTSQHTLIAGKTGSGKSTLLHVLITQLALTYSPREVELYLIDFKKGVEFKAYATNALPHARVVAVESEREFGLSVLQRLDVELTRRGELYRNHGLNDLASYRALLDGGADLPPMPRVMLIVDEFQEFFVEDDKVAQESALLMDRLVRQGRAFGVHVLLGSQTLGGAYSLARSTIDQMAVRIALQCSEADAHLILSRENNEARLLSRPGEAIYNASHGLLEGNHLFQIVWLGDDRRDELLREVRAQNEKRWASRMPIVFEGTAAVEITQNRDVPRCLEHLAHGPPWHAWLGEPVAIKEPTAATFRKQTSSNLLIVGQHEQTAFALTASALISLGVQAERASPVHLIVAQALDAEGEALLPALSQTLPIQLRPQRELPALLAELSEELDRRLQDASAGPPVFLCLYGLQRLRDLRRPEDDFGFARQGEKPSPYRQFVQLLKEGPPLGMFTLLWCDTYTNLQRCFDRQTLREFDLRVLLQMSGADSSSLIDLPVAAKLGPSRAIFFTEDQGRVEKFRPYALPTPAWVRGLVRVAGNGAVAVHTPQNV
jgi:DNA segregation ATPase FtsK/SpoIIIE, S-DNA-T family